MRNRIMWRVASVASAALLTAWSAAAQAPPSPPGGPGASPPKSSMPSTPPAPTAGKGSSEMTGTAAVIPARDTNQITAKELIGNNVVTKDGVEVGKVQDIILDREGKVTGVVIATGGFLGIGSKPVGVSSNAVDMRASKEQEVVFVNMNSNEIKEAPALKRGDEEKRQLRRERRGPGGGLGGAPGAGRTGIGGAAPGQ